MTGRRSRIVAVLVALSLALIGSMPAFAGAGFGIGSGSGGTFSPGLGVIPTPQSFVFTTTLSRTGLYCGGVEVTTPTAFAVAGTDVVGSLAAGEGNVNAYVNGGGCAFGLTGVFTRAGLTMDLILTSGIYVIHATCVLAPGQAPPATIDTFTPTCTVIFAGTSW